MEKPIIFTLRFRTPEEKELHKFLTKKTNVYPNKSLNRIILNKLKDYKNDVENGKKEH